MLQRPIYIENEQIIVHPFGPEDLKRYELLVRDIFDIFTDDYTLKYLPEKRLENMANAEQFLNTSVISFHTGRNYIHFITDKTYGKVIGMINLISPEMAKEFYNLKDYQYFLEFYLVGQASGCYIMSKILPTVVEILLNQGIENLYAVVNKKISQQEKCWKKPILSIKLHSARNRIFLK